MGTTTVKRDVAERNLQLTGEFTRYLLQNPAVLEALPDNFELVLLPDNDPELQTYSLHLLNQRQATADRPVVLVWIRARQNGTTNYLPRFQFYVPVDQEMVVAHGL